MTVESENHNSELSSLRVALDSAIAASDLSKIQSIEDSLQGMQVGQSTLTAHDARRCKEAVEAARRQIEESRPKKKFSFKSKPTAGASKKIEKVVGESTKKQEKVKEAVPAASAGLGASNLKERVIRFSSSGEGEEVPPHAALEFKNLSRCAVEIPPCGSIHLEGCKKCFFFAHSVSGPLFVDSSEEVLLRIGEVQQIRINLSSDLFFKFLKDSKSGPIIEKSRRIFFISPPLDCEGRPGMWNQVRDFSWLKKQASPNWAEVEEDKVQTLLTFCAESFQKTDAEIPDFFDSFDFKMNNGGGKEEKEDKSDDEI